MSSGPRRLRYSLPGRVDRGIKKIFVFCPAVALKGSSIFCDLVEPSFSPFLPN